MPFWVAVRDMLHHLLPRLQVWVMILPFFEYGQCNGNADFYHLHQIVASMTPNHDPGRAKKVLTQFMERLSEIYFSVL